MKKIVYTQRVEVIEGYSERRDCADQNIVRFLYACGFLPMPISNIPSLIDELCDSIDVDGVMFTGGNDLVSYGGNAPERDEMEKRLLEYAVRKGIPLFGICRGMQMIGDYFGAKLEPVDNHIRKNHKITGAISRDKVNSFHGMGIRTVKPPLQIAAASEDGVVEAIRHEHYRIAGIMWHPERVDGFSKDDIQLISKFFNGGTFV